MKKWITILIEIIIILAVVVWLIFLGFSIFGFKGKAIDELDLTQKGEEQRIDIPTKSIDEYSPNESLFALLGQIRDLNYTAIVQGEVSALGGFYKQKIDGQKFCTSDKSLYISKTTSSFFKDGKKILIDSNNQVQVLQATDVVKDEWEGNTTTYTLQNYLNEYGVDFRELSNYTLNSETILFSQKLSSTNGVYVFEYNLDPEKATIGYRLNMAKMGGLSSLPEFASCKITVSMGEDFKPLSVVCEDHYKVALLGGLTCSSTLTTTYGNVGSEITFPELQQFN